MTDSEKILLALLLEQVSGLGIFRIRNLLRVYDSISQIQSASVKNLSSVDGIGEQSAAEIKKTKLDLEAANKIIKQVEQHQAKIFGFWMDEFPERLKNLDGMPVLLYYKGNPAALNSNGIAIVGTRNPSQYGKRITENLTTELVQNNLTIFSGFARGIDTLAHSTALKENGCTVAVLGSGFNNLYPAENKSLLPKIYENGGILTEFPPDTKPDAKNFPQRNRLISGLSLGSVIVESAESGGALITAAYALEQNREVFAIPGEVFSEKSKGTNLLIMNGTAKLILSAKDILCELKLDQSTNKIKARPIPELSMFEQVIFDKLDTKPKHIDELTQELNQSVSELLIQLLNLEFKGIIRQLPGKYFVRN